METMQDIADERSELFPADEAVWQWHPFLAVWVFGRSNIFMSIDRLSWHGALYLVQVPRPDRVGQAHVVDVLLKKLDLLERETEASSSIFLSTLEAALSKQNRASKKGVYRYTSPGHPLMHLGVGGRGRGGSRGSSRP